jgi:hypothetical protein
MRKAARERGLGVKKERDSQYQAGAWDVRHVCSRERLLRGSRDEAAAFIAAYDPGKERLGIIGAIPKLVVFAPMVDWPGVRDEDSGFEYAWENLERVQKLLADFEPGSHWVRPEAPPEPGLGEALLGWRGGVLETINMRRDLTNLYLTDLSPLKAIEDEGERRRAATEAGRLRALIDYVLERRATWPEIAAEEKAILLEAEAIASMRSDHGRHGDAAENRVFRLTKADEREVKLNERRAALDKRLGIDTVRRYWWPPIREAREGIEKLQAEIVAGHHVENLPRIHERLEELAKLISYTDRLAQSADLRERARKIRQSKGDKQGLAEPQSAEEQS